MIRLVIVAGIRLYREGLAQLLDRHPALTVVGLLSGGRETWTTIGDFTPDVVLLDMATDESYEIARDLRSRIPEARIVALGVADSDPELVACAETGIAGYVRREGSLEDLVATVQSAAKGELICSPRTAGTLLRRLANLAGGRERAPTAERLTPREREIADLLQQDLSNKEIAVRLRIEVATVKNHVHNLFEKLRVHRRSDAAHAVGGPSRG